jgi:hypothetical protein
VIRKLAELPPSEAVILAVPLVEIVATLAWKEALDAPTGTTTDAGTDNEELSLDSGTFTPPAGAAPVIDTVHAVRPLSVIVPGLHETDETRDAAETLTRAFRLTPPAAAVMDDWPVPDALALAVNVVLVEPPAMVTDAGTVITAVLLLDSTTAKPALGAAFVNPTAQVLLAP